MWIPNPIQPKEFDVERQTADALRRSGGRRKVSDAPVDRDSQLDGSHFRVVSKRRISQEQNIESDKKTTKEMQNEYCSNS